MWVGLHYVKFSLDWGGIILRIDWIIFWSLEYALELVGEPKFHRSCLLALAMWFHSAWHLWVFFSLQEHFGLLIVHSWRTKQEQNNTILVGHLFQTI